MTDPRHASAFFDAARGADTEDCILWPFAKTSAGYPQVWRRGKWTGAHREMCFSVHGEPPTIEHHAAHSCGNRSCINPRHLSWKTPSANEIDKRGHGTDIGGERHPSHKLTTKQVLEIRAIGRSISQTAIAAKFGISQTQVGAILRGTRWTSL